MSQIADAASVTLIKEAAAFAARDASYKARFEAEFVDHLPLRKRLAVILLLRVLGGQVDRVPVWSRDAVLTEIRRRMDAR